MKVEGLLGFLGAALGIGFSLMVLVIPDISQALEEESFFFYMLTIGSLVLSGVGLAGSFIVSHKPRLGGAMMVAYRNWLYNVDFDYVLTTNRITCCWRTNCTN